MEREYLEKWLNDIDNSIKEEEQGLENLQEAALWPGASTLSEIENESQGFSHFSESITSDVKLPVEERLTYYKARSLRSIQQKRQQQVQEEMDNLKNPLISKRSQKLASSNRDGKIEDRLMQEGIKQKMLQIKKEAQLSKEAKVQANPIITPLAASLKREGDIVDRLFEYQKIYQEKLENKKNDSPKDSKGIPKINKINGIESKYMKPNSPKTVYVETFSYKPEVNKKSEILASKLGDPKDRLLQKPKEKNLEDSEYTFKPSINRRENDPNKIEWWESLYQHGQFIKEKRERTKEEMDKIREEDPNLTFKPTIVTKGHKQESNEERFKRLEAWSKQKEQKIEEAKAQNSNKDLEGCTFAPKINKRLSSSKPKIETKGVDKFLQRQGLAKKNKNENDSPKKYQTETRNEDISAAEFENAMKALHDELHSINLNM
ncbi:unnamed protein product [Blepharisma stoltei]|uniref:Uncharacterized protein n=1 Tax=Blepharisma stoltei TaxID=1481888 RepID=A0AAU9JKF1_9CILI|nr:unnamed protein product [Blepharisma stoltei]